MSSSTKRRLLDDSKRTSSKIVQIMADGDKEVMDFLEKYIDKEPFSLQWIDVLDIYQIYGKSILVFFTKCCNGDLETFSETLLGLDNYSFADDYRSQMKLVKYSIKNESDLAFQC